MEGPDHRASITPEDLKQLIASIRDIEKALGDGIKQPIESELPVRQLVRKSISYRHNLSGGSVLSEDDLIMLRPGDGIQPKEAKKIVGQIVNEDVLGGTQIQWEDLT